MVPLAATFALAAAAFAAPVPAAAPVSAEVFEKHLAAVASDEFEGRKPATAGERRTLDYLVSEFSRLGLRPGVGGGYLQPVQLVEITAGSDAALAFDTPAGDRRLAYGADAVIWTKRVQREVSIERSPLVFVGYGVVAPEYGWNDYAGVDMRGKTAVILVNDPGFATDDPDLFRGRALTYYGRWIYKFEEAARQGAAGAIIVHETEAASYPWDVVVNGGVGPRLDMASADGNAGRAAIEGWMTRDAARQLFAAMGQDFEALRLAANRRGFRPVPLPGTATASLRNSIRESLSSNVVGYIRGTRRPDEYVVYCAHWDHLGRAIGRSGDTIFNGAEDNGTGLAGLLALADAFQRAKARPERSVVFLSVTAEEAGLVGSAKYVEDPPFPLAKTVGVINMDTMHFGGPRCDIRVVGYGQSQLQEYLADAAAAAGRVIRPEPTPEKGFFYRSDQFNFARKGVPSLYTKLGIDDVEHGAGWGQRQEDEYYAVRYHKPSDEYRPGVDLRGTLDDLQLLYAVGVRLARERTFPNWYPDSEFRAIRDRSRAGAK
jgi:Zn-dependent M28 family amino/carboxypeptidase